MIMYSHYCNYLMNDASHAIIYFLLDEDIAVSISLITVGVFLMLHVSELLRESFVVKG